MPERVSDQVDYISPLIVIDKQVTYCHHIFTAANEAQAHQQQPERSH